MLRYSALVLSVYILLNNSPQEIRLHQRDVALMLLDRERDKKKKLLWF